MVGDKISRARLTFAAVAGLVLLGATGLAVAAGVPNTAAGSSDAATVRAAAETAAVSWQTLFIEEPQAGVTAPGQARAERPAQMSSASTQGFVTRSSASAAKVFEGAPLQVLTSSLASEVQTSSAAAVLKLQKREGRTRATTTADAKPSAMPGYTICVAGGARGFRFTSVHVNKNSATVAMTAYAWTTNVDVDSSGHSTLDTAQGPGTCHIGLHRSAAGQWLVDAFDAAPAAG